MKIGGVRSYPKEIVVGDQVWTIHFARCLEDKPLKPARNGKEPKRVVGYCDPSDCSIWILLGQGPLETFSTFLHEVQHCFEFEGDFDMPHKVIYKTELWWAKFIIENCLEINNVVFSGEYYRGRGNAFKGRRPLRVVASAAKVRTRVRKRSKNGKHRRQAPSGRHRCSCGHGKGKAI